MAKHKISQKQTRNIKNRHHKLLKDDNFESLSPDSSLGPLRPGIVVSRFGKRADVEDTQTHLIYRAFIRRTIDSLTTGDNVLFRIDTQHNDGSGGLIETLIPRKSLLSRPDFYDGLKPVAANISKILIVSAKEPEFSTNILDRYLIACEQAKIEPVIVINKIDLFSPDELNKLQKIFETYQSLGYKIYKVSSYTNEGIEELTAEILNDTTVLVGQSGVGKSSLLNILVPHADAQTNEISDTSGLGQHTTTNTKLYHIGQTGLIIDSPGVREFALWHLTPTEVTQSYREFLPILGQCKFRDCKHHKDPGCAIVKAVSEGTIAEFRFNNYHKILESMTQNKPDAYVTPGKKYGKLEK
jgi:ribosome biogenesis GTPase